MSWVGREMEILLWMYDEDGRLRRLIKKHIYVFSNVEF